MLVFEVCAGGPENFPEVGKKIYLFALGQPHSEQITAGLLELRPVKTNDPRSFVPCFLEKVIDDKSIGRV